MQQADSPKSCPKCRLINPAAAERCDCGWDFVAQRQERSYLPATPVSAAAGIGAGLIVIYVVVRLVIALVRASTP